VTIAPRGTSVIADPATGTTILAALGELGATQAALVTSAINTESGASATRRAVES
jgi:hypothetical protein